MAAGGKGAQADKKTLAELLGLAEKPVRWSGVAAFLLGHWAMAVLVLLFVGGLFHLADLHLWIGQAARSLILTGSVVAGFRLSRDQFLAAFVSAAIFTALWWGVVGHLQYLVPFMTVAFLSLFDTFISPLCLLLGLVIMLRVIPITLVALVAGALLGTLAYDLLGGGMWLLQTGEWYAMGLSAWTLFRALAFGIAFWGALKLFERPGSGPGADGDPTAIGPS